MSDRLKLGDRVRVTGGEHAGRTGAICHWQRGNVYIDAYYEVHRLVRLDAPGRRYHVIHTGDLKRIADAVNGKE